MQTPERKLFRLASIIHEQLVVFHQTRYQAVLQEVQHLLEYMESLQRWRKRMTICNSRHWSHAARKIAERLQPCLRDIPFYVGEIERTAETCKRSCPSVSDVFAEIRQLQAEFERFEYDVKQQTVSVTTEAIELEDVYLGEFSIQLHIDRLSQVPRRRNVYRIVALDPHPATTNDAVTHPHVRDEELCAGDATAATLSTHDEGFRAVERIGPDVLGITATVGGYRAALELANHVKTVHPETFIVLGGPYLSALWRECLTNRPYVDAVVVGEGQYPLVSILRNRPLTEIPGVASRLSTGKPYLCPPRLYAPDSYPDPDWSGINARPYQESYSMLEHRPDVVLGTICSTRGCSWRCRSGGCLFCAIAQPRVRARSPKRVWAEVQRLHEEQGCNAIWDFSPSLTGTPEWLHELAEAKPRQLAVEFHAYARAAEIEPDVVTALRRLNCVELFIGVESGDDRLLQGAHKGCTSLTNVRAVDLLSQAGINTFASIVLGLPGEDASTLQRTYGHILQLKEKGLSCVSTCILTPYPGSKAFRMVLHDPSTPDVLQTSDVFDWVDLSKRWVQMHCNASIDQLHTFARKLESLPGCHHENNYDYIPRTWRIEAQDHAWLDV